METVRLSVCRQCAACLINCLMYSFQVYPLYTFFILRVWGGWWVEINTCICMLITVHVPPLYQALCIVLVRNIAGIKHFLHYKKSIWFGHFRLWAYIMKRTLWSVHYWVYIMKRTLWSVHYWAYIMKRTLWSVHYEAYIIECTLWSVHYWAYIIECTLLSVHYWAYIMKRTLWSVY
jgi:hypothetical protein